MIPQETLLLLQTGVTGRQPAYFIIVFVGSLLLGGIGWLIASVLGFARARAFGPATRWFSFAAVCLLIYHIQFVFFAFMVYMGAQQNDIDTPLQFGAFMNIFIVLGAICAIMGFVRLTNPPR
ncbi:MAG TPA: hypothetical protein VE961_13045 [Pyrinomonadaceae bacterium]|nr:hypothetical protein [Pyrinomonadaceae bacterium]